MLCNHVEQLKLLDQYVSSLRMKKMKQDLKRKYNLKGQDNVKRNVTIISSMLEKSVYDQYEKYKHQIK